jgi:hypothetical protein
VDARLLAEHIFKKKRASLAQIQDVLILMAGFGDRKDKRHQQSMIE